MPRKVGLITGVTGMDGSHLADFLLEQGYEVIGMVRRTSTLNFERISHIQDKITIVQGDLHDEASLVDVLREFNPTEVYNLAAQSFVPTSFKQPVLTGEVTALGVTRILDAIRIVDPKVRFYQASSSEMFGWVQQVPQTEKTPFYPRSPYGVAKVYGHWITVNYRESYNLFACSGILFNHEGPRRGLEFSTHKITHAAAKIKLGLQKDLKLGNIHSKRDWGYAPDYVRGMWLMLQQPEPGDYVLATGIQHTVLECAQIAFNCVDLDLEQYLISDNPPDLRPADVINLVGDSSKARQKLGWEPTVTFAQMIQIMVDADLAALKKNG